MSVALIQHAIFAISKPQFTVQSALHNDCVQLAVGYFVSAQKDHVSNTIDKTLKCLKFSEGTRRHSCGVQCPIFTHTQSVLHVQDK